MQSETKQNFSAKLTDYINSLDFAQIPLERKVLLFMFVDYLKASRKAEIPLQAIFVCKHNSRRSQFTQLWSEIAASFYGIAFQGFSAGTEETACYPETLKAIERCGCAVSLLENAGSNNRKHEVNWGSNHTTVLFSKTLAHQSLPKNEFAAVMTCSDADSNCPFVPGSDIRIPLTYVDPKHADNSPDKALVYDKTCRQIATELFYVFHQLSDL